MVDSEADIIKKYRLNISGLFKRLRLTLSDAAKEGVSVLPETFVNIAEEKILSLDEGINMIQLVRSVTEHKCLTMIVDKDVTFLESHWKVFMGKDAPQMIVDAANSIFTAKKSDGSYPYSQENINKIFDFVLSLYKVSVKYVLLKSNILEMERVGDMVMYTTENNLIDWCDGDSLSALIYRLKITGVPTPS